METDREINYRYDAKQRLMETTDGFRFVYDAAGRVIERDSPQGQQKFMWDSYGRLVEIRFDDGTQVGYDYDPLSRLVRRVDRQGNTTRFVYDGLNLIEERKEDETVLASYVYGGGLDHPVLMVARDQVYLFIYDRLGSVVALVDTTGQALARYSYDAWGNILEETAKIHQPFRFASYFWDPDVTLYYCRARWYDPTVGRFLSPDPILPLSLNPQDWNAYIYAKNDPVNRVDPLGLQSWPPYEAGGYLRWRPYEAGESHAHRFAQQQREAHRFAQQQREAQQLTQLAQRQHERPLLSAYDRLVSGLGELEMTAGRIDPLGLNPTLLFTRGIAGMTGGFIGGEATTLQKVSGILIPVVIPQVSMPRTAALVAIRTMQGRYGDALGAISSTAIPGIAGSIIRKSAPSGMEGLAQGAELTLKGVLTAGKMAQQLSEIAPIHSQSDVGGILLDQSAKSLADLTDIRGAVWDNDHQQLILVGTKDRSLPPTRLDDLLVALEALYSGKEIGVSIDPGTTHGEMIVRYIPERIRNTHLGAVLFEADRILKILSMGQDNITKRPVRSQVPGYHSELELAIPNLLEVGRSVWHRMWFVPEELSLRETDGIFIYDKATLDIRTQYFNPQNPALSPSGSDPAAEKFVTHLKDNFDAYARERPVLAELVQAAKLVGVVKWLRNNSIHVDLGWLSDRTPVSAKTDSTTPADTVWHTVKSQGFLIHLGLYGGVDLSPEPSSKSDPSLGQLRETVLMNRPSQGAVSWDFVWEGKRWTAVATSLAPQPMPGGLRWAEVDLDITAGLYPWLGLVRYFDSQRLGRSSFGPGWSAVPFTLEFPKAYAMIQNLQPEVVLLDRIAGSSWTFRLGRDSNQRLRYGLQRGEPAMTLERNADGYSVQDRGIHLDFDWAGQLQRIHLEDGTEATYSWTEGRLSGINLPGGRTISLVYNREGQIIEAKDHTGRSVHYDYDVHSRLVRAHDRLGNRTTYAYDDSGRLAEARGSEGGRKVFAKYDAMGRLVLLEPYGWEFTYNENRSVTIRSGETTLGILHYDRLGRMVRFEGSDGTGWSATRISEGIIQLTTDDQSPVLSIQFDQHSRPEEITHPEMGSLFSVVRDSDGRILSITDRFGATTRFEYNEQVRLNRVTTAYEGHSVDISYDNAGRLVSLKDPDGVMMQFGRTRDGQLNSIQFGNVSPFTIERDPLDRVIAVSTPLGDITHIQWDDRDRLVGLEAPYTRFYVKYVQNGITIWDGEGRELRYMLDEYGRLRGVHDAGGAALRLDYDLSGNLARIVRPDSTVIDFVRDELGQVAEIYTNRNERMKIQYDKMGRVLQVDSGERWQRFSYDSLGRILRLQQNPGVGTEIEYLDDHNGIRVKNEDGEVSFEGDLIGRIVRSTDVDGRQVRYQYTPGNRSSRIGYPSKPGRIRRLFDRILPSGLQVFYAYDERGLLQSISLGREDRIAATFDYDANGYMTWVRAGATTIERQYTAGSLPSQIRAKTADDITVFEAHYEYDQTGLCVKESGTGGTRTYSYDKIGRLQETRYGTEYGECRGYDAEGDCQIILLTRSGCLNWFSAWEEDDLSYQNARAQGTKAAYTEYLIQWPQGRHVAEAQEALELIQAQEQQRLAEQQRIPEAEDRRDDGAYELAEYMNTEESYRAYQRSFPKGRHVGEASAAIKKIRIENATHHVSRAWDLYKQKQYKETEVEFREAIRLDPENGSYYYGLAWALMQQNRIREAEIEAERAGRQGWPGYEVGSIFYSIGDMWFKQNRYQEASKAFQAALRLDSSKAGYHDYYGVTLSYQGKWKEAEIAFRKAISLNAQVGRYPANLASALYSQGQHEEAMKAAEEAIRLGEKDHPIYKTLGLNKKEGDKKALPTLLIRGEVVSFNPSDPAAPLLIVKDRRGFEMSIFFTQNTQVMQDDVTIPPADLVPGISVEVEYNFDVHTAKRQAVSVKVISVKGG